MLKLKFAILNVVLICFVLNLPAQKLDSAAKKTGFKFKMSLPHFSFKSNKPQKSVIVSDATSSTQGTIGETLSQVSQKTTLSVMTGVSFSKQSIAAAGYTSNINYNISENNNNLFKPGFFGGVRIDGTFHQQHAYSLSASLQKIASGINYTSYNKMPPYIGKFSSFKGEESFVLLNLAAHYKKLIPIGDRVRYQLYVVAGPSVDVNIAGTSLDNQVSDAYKNLFFKGDAGLEFYNRSNYNLFFHYHQSVGSITGSSINTSLSNFEIGMMVKAKDLF